MWVSLGNVRILIDNRLSRTYPVIPLTLHIMHCPWCYWHHRSHEVINTVVWPPPAPVPLNILSHHLRQIMLIPRITSGDATNWINTGYYYFVSTKQTKLSLHWECHLPNSDVLTYAQSKKSWDFSRSARWFSISLFISQYIRLAILNGNL